MSDGAAFCCVHPCTCASTRNVCVVLPHGAAHIWFGWWGRSVCVAGVLALAKASSITQADSFSEAVAGRCPLVLLPASSDACAVQSPSRVVRRRSLRTLSCTYCTALRIMASSLQSGSRLD